MDKELNKRLTAILEEGSEHLLEDEDTGDLVLLKSEGYLVAGRILGVPPPVKLLYTSIAGRKYLERLKTPKKAWLKKNWFAASIAAITGVAALASVIVQILGLILD